MSWVCARVWNYCAKKKKNLTRNLSELLNRIITKCWLRFLLSSSYQNRSTRRFKGKQTEMTNFKPPTLFSPFFHPLALISAIVFGHWADTADTVSEKFLVVTLGALRPGRRNFSKIPRFSLAEDVFFSTGDLLGTSVWNLSMCWHCFPCTLVSSWLSASPVVHRGTALVPR